MDDTRRQQRKAPNSLPRHEIELLAYAEAQAADLAARRQVLAGFQALERGVARAEREHASGAPHGAELLREWRGSAEAFTRRYGGVLLVSLRL